MGPETCYMTYEEDIYFITSLSRRGEYFLEFPDVSHGVEIEIQLIYSQRYVGAHVVHPSDFQVRGGQLWVSSFVAQRLGASKY